MKTILLMMALSIHGIFFTDELEQPIKIAGLCFLIALGAFIAFKSAIIDDESDYK
jgi:hypothetical protein